MKVAMITKNPQMAGTNCGLRKDDLDSLVFNFGIIPHIFVKSTLCRTIKRIITSDSRIQHLIVSAW